MINATTDIFKYTKSLNVLYVEDEESSRKQIASILSIFFASVATAVDGQDGWEQYEQGAFDLVITDISMPSMNGIELLQKIKSKEPLQKVVIISAHDNGDYLLSAIRYGADSFLLKPVEQEQLEDVLYKVSSAIYNEKLQKAYQIQLESEVKKKSEALIEQAMRDKLTGVFNRNKLDRMLLEPGHKVLMLLDIDNFDNINTTYGYYNGDLIMQQVVHFFKEHGNKNAQLFRIGHDEFAFLYSHTSMDSVYADAQRLQKDIAAHPIEYENTIVKLTFTIILAEGEKDLLRNVHIGHKQTRNLGKNRIGVYKKDSHVEKKQKQIQKCTYILHQAVEESKIFPYFQPIVDNETQKIDKYECLARMEHDGKIYGPATFLETAELTGMLPRITRIMIDKSFDYFQQRQETFSINISEIDLNDDYLEAFLEEKSKAYGIDPSRVVLEVLEGISANGAQNSLNQLISLREKGFQLAIDDFGAQNSNFERVYRLSVDYIKIDGSFIKEIDNNVNSYNIAKAITDFAKSINAKVIAEHVDSPNVFSKVKELGIEFSQGYFFGKPQNRIDQELL